VSGLPTYVSGLEEVDRSQVAQVGGKAAGLGELSRIDGIRVPAGFCITTDAFRRVMAQAPSLAARLDELSPVEPDDSDAIRSASAAIRETIEGISIPDDLADAITRRLGQLGDRAAYAVRSSATAEDLPSASFAGQQDSYLNVEPAAVLEHVNRCWASLFTERAVTYRLRNGFDHRQVSMAVVVQQMVSARAAGVLFTADPVSSNRKVASVEAVLGLGELLVSGRVNPDVYKVRDGEVVERTISADQPVLADTQVVAVVRTLSRRPTLSNRAVMLIDLAERFRVDEVPSLALVVGQRVVSRLEGRATAPRIESMLEPHLGEEQIAV